MLDADRGVSFEEGHGKVIEKTLSVQSDLDFRGVLGIVPLAGPNDTFAKSIETFFEISIIPAPSFRGGGYYAFR